MCLMTYVNNKGADQPAHPHSLISTFVVHCLDSMRCILAYLLESGQVYYGKENQVAEINFCLLFPFFCLSLQCKT